MIAIFDVFYHANVATVAAVLAKDWSDETVTSQFITSCQQIGDYVAGEFYQRELKPLIQILQKIDQSIQYYVIDAYCHLSADFQPGLGAYLSNELPPESIVIGVAKNRFRMTTHAVEVCRGESVRPLFVTSIGIDYSMAADRIKSMHGDHRIPTLLKRVDQLSRSGVANGG